MKNLKDSEDLYIAVFKDPHDFDVWESLVNDCGTSSTRLQGNTTIEELRERSTILEAFLSKYPTLCNYWISYARSEVKAGNFSKAQDVYLRGLAYVKNDVQLWMSFLKFKLEITTTKDEELCRWFELARKYIGLSYYGVEFYQLYLQYLRTLCKVTPSKEESVLLLLRLMIDIPSYNYANTVNEVREQLSSTHLERLYALLGETESYSAGTKKLRDLMWQRFARRLDDIFAQVQNDTYVLYSFEIALQSSLLEHEVKPVARQHAQAWSSYLTYVETHYSQSYTLQLYERCLIAVGARVEIILKYIDFTLSRGLKNTAKSIMRKYLSQLSGASYHEVFMRLIDLEMSLGRFQAAKNSLTRYILASKRVPTCARQKLLQVESYMSSGDLNYISRLTKELCPPSAT